MLFGHTTISTNFCWIYTLFLPSIDDIIAKKHIASRRNLLYDKKCDDKGIKAIGIKDNTTFLT